MCDVSHLSRQRISPVSFFFFVGLVACRVIRGVGRFDSHQIFYG